MTEQGGATPEPAHEAMPGARASDADRQRVVKRLQDAAAEGMLDLDELEDRLGATWQARTIPELATITSDLPVPRSGQPEPAPPSRRRIGPAAFRSAGFRAHFATWGLTNGFFSGIWLVTGADGFFWPFFPAGGWGIGLGLHYLAAGSAVRRRERRGRLGPGRSRVVPPVPAVPAVGPVPPTPPASGTGRLGLVHGTEPTSRYVVAAFVDVVGSTQLNETLGDQGWARVRSRFHQLVAAVLDDHGGREANRAGDGLLLRFEHPDDAVRALVDILRRLDHQRAETGFAPSVRAGIHSGDAVDEGDDIIGRVVNLAARVAEAAEPDELLVTEHVADHLADGHDVVSRGLHTLKGVTRPRNLIAVRWR